MTKIYNITSGKQKRQTLRNETPPAEQRLWARLRGRQILGFKFRRQYSVDHYVIDFYCPRLKLAIEVDGDSHFQDAAEDYDAQRQQYIEALGIRFLRFTNREVYERLNDVLEVILRTLREMDSNLLPDQTRPPPPPPPGKGGGGTERKAQKKK
jgi:very-short-patch-repair endonuclease